MKKGVENSAVLAKMKGRSFLGKIITMNESAVSMNTSETKIQSKQGSEKGKPGFTNDKVYASYKMMICFQHQRDGVL
jgi:hypothetical protein